jgi:hypothetical protein
MDDFGKNQQKSIFIKIIIFFISSVIIFGIIFLQQNKKYKQEQETQKRAMERAQVKTEEIRRTTDEENRRREQENNRRIEQALSPLRIKCLNLVANNISVQELLRILVEYDSGGRSISSITLDLRFSVSRALSSRGIRFEDSIADYILEEDIVYQPPNTKIGNIEVPERSRRINVSTDEMADLVVQTLFSHKDKFRNIPVDERSNTYGKFIFERNIYVYEAYRK